MIGPHLKSPVPCCHGEQVTPWLQSMADMGNEAINPNEKVKPNLIGRTASQAAYGGKAVQREESAHAKGPVGQYWI